MISISRMRNEEGFTLIELLIVIVVLGILAGIVLFAVGNTKTEAENAKATSNTRICKTAKAAALASAAPSDTYADFIDTSTPITCS
jgi:general secretion pathway protein G